MFWQEIFFITDRTYCSLSPEEMVSHVLASGIRCIQYRDKEKSRREIYETAVRLRELTRSCKATLIINDHADIALSVDAEGVHLGQDDLPLGAARRLMGKKLIGISTHTLQQAQAAADGGADYIGFGPIFHTSTKDAGLPVGVDNIRLIKQNVSIPVAAIGGIDLSNVESVLEAGADAVAVATAICRGNIDSNCRDFIIKLLSFKTLSKKE